ncbi:MAG: WbqC family protein, partial [Flavobacteriaceae bacterium]|nr:WbqC family protein [Flavobacteriaceae bacterium]
MDKKVFSCHQPNFLPWVGYFHKIYNSDIFVLLDEVQYPKNSVANRNKIKSAQGDQFITVPITKKINNSSFFTYKEATFAQKNWYEKTK